MGKNKKKNNHHKKRKLRGSRGHGQRQAYRCSRHSMTVVNSATTMSSAATPTTTTSKNVLWSSSNCCCDLFVTLPKSFLLSSQKKKVSMMQQQLKIQELIERLQSTGYTDMALTHVIYGRPKTTTATTTTKTTLDQSMDAADIVIPTSLTNNNKQQNKIRILRRLHAIVETVSDVAIYHNTSGSSSSDDNNTNGLFWKGYDLISLGPTNDATFQAACRHAKGVDIVTIDYTQRLGWKLPYQIQSQDLQALMDRGGTLEICLAPALLNLQHRKSLIHACREILLAYQNVTKHPNNNNRHQQHQQHSLPPIILSSGNRTILQDNHYQDVVDDDDDNDAGAMALRTMGDLQTLAKTILGFPPALVRGCMTTLPAQVIQHGQERRCGIVSSSSSSSFSSFSPQIQIQDYNTTSNTTTTLFIGLDNNGTKGNTGEESDISPLVSRGNINPNNHDQNDGFIAM